jgi:hypothetical protein
MALVVKDRVKQTTTTTGTGNIVLNGNVDGFQTFAAALADGDTTYFGIFVPSTNDYEVGLGTWTEGSATLARTTILESSNSGSAINITAQAEVFITQPAEKAVFQDANGDVDLGGNKILFGNLYSTTGDLPSASTYHGMFAHVHGTGKAYYAHGGNWIELVNEDTSGNVSMGGNLTVTGDLTVNGTTTTVSTTNTVVKDSLIELGNGTSGSPSNDAGIVIERGSSDNAFIGYDESADKFTVGTGSFTGATTGNLTISTGTLVANVEGNVTGNVTGNTSGTAATVTTAAQPNITSVGTLTTLTVDDITIDGSTISDGGDVTIDSGGDITLDADGGDVKISDGGTHVGSLRNVGSDFVIQSIISDQNIIFKGNDGGSEINALSFDMSENGVANFAAGASFEGDISITAATNAKLTINDNVGEVGSGNLAFQAQNTSGSSLKPMGFRAEDIRFATGSAERVRINDSGLTVGEITINADTITATDDFIIDVASDIKLDANGGHINFFDNGTPILSFQNSSTDAVIWSRASDRDMIFKGNDGGSVITGLTLDFSDAGTAIFNHDIKLADNNKAIFGASSDLQIYHDTTYNHSIIEETGSGNLTLKGDNLFLTRQGSGDNYLGAVADGAVTLYYDGTSKLATTANGINVAGDVVVTNDIYVADQIIHEGDTDTYFAFDTNEINIYSGGTHHARFNTNDFITYSALKEDYDALSGTSPTIDVDAGGGFSLTTSGNTTFTFSSCTSGVAVGFVLQVTAGGSHSLTWPGTVDWAGGSAPDAPASGESNLYVFYTRDGGSNWIGVLSAAAYG